MDGLGISGTTAGFYIAILGILSNPERTKKQKKSTTASADAILNKHLKNRKYLAGSLFTIADIAVGTFFLRYYNMGVTVEEFENVNIWYQHLFNRGPYQKTIALPFDELKG